MSLNRHPHEPPDCLYSTTRIRVSVLSFWKNGVNSQLDGSLCVQVPSVILLLKDDLVALPQATDALTQK